MSDPEKNAAISTLIILCLAEVVLVVVDTFLSVQTMFYHSRITLIGEENVVGLDGEDLIDYALLENKVLNSLLIVD